jgi:serine protease inhibitor
MQKSIGRKAIMKHLINLGIIFLVVILWIMSCEQITDPIGKNVRRPLTSEEIALVSADNRFGLKIFQSIAATQSDSNIFISPLSISMALGMTLNGALAETREAMEQTLELQGLTQQQINESYQTLIQLLTQLDPAVIFHIANSIWYRQDMPIKQPFLDLNRQYFDARIEGLDFNDPQSVEIINQWVKDQTNDRIKKIIEQIDPVDLMFLINAIYFKGDWTYKFKEELTQPADFYGLHGNVYPCQLMHQEGDFLYLHTNDFQAVDLPYGIGDFRMALFLPFPEKNLDSLIAGITNEILANWLASFVTTQGILEIPKLKMEYKLELKKVLSQLGMGIAFDPYQANFKDIYEGPENAFISKVLHKTFVQVDEEGTEAAAVTSVTVSLSTSVGGGFYLRADRPFFFIIHDTHSNTILFVGKIIQAEWN